MEPPLNGWEDFPVWAASCVGHADCLALKEFKGMDYVDLDQKSWLEEERRRVQSTSKEETTIEEEMISGEQTASGN